MKLFEYQAKELFEESGIPIPKGKLVNNVSELDGAVEEVGLPCAIKAQALQGGRGKAGLIQFASSAGDARTKFEQVLEKIEDGHGLLVEQALDIDKELYLSITPEPVSGTTQVKYNTQRPV